MSRRILCLFTALVLALSPIGCNGDKPASSGPPRIKDGGGGDLKASGPVQGGGKGSAFKGND